MKNLKLLTGIFLILTAFTFTSCENEPIDSAIILDDGGSGGSGGGGGGGGTSGDYWPTALNNQWVFTQNGVTQPPNKIISINAIGGFTYYTFGLTSGGGGGSSASATQRLRKNSGDYFLKSEDSTISSGGFTGVQTGFELLLLKDYLPVGGTWTGSYTQTTTYTDPLIPVITGTTTYTGTILEVGSSVTVGTTTYTDVIKMRLHELVAFEGLSTTEVDIDYWYAKNVGPVKSIIYATGSTTTPQYTSLLTSYILN